MVIPWCTLNAAGQTLTYDKSIIFRDIGFYIIATFAIMIYAFDGSFDWIKST